LVLSRSVFRTDEYYFVKRISYFDSKKYASLFTMPCLLKAMFPNPQPIYSKSSGSSYQWSACRLLLLTKRFFCDKPDCPVKIFTERFEWLSANGRRTLRTEEVLRKMAFLTSCLTAEKVARSAHIPVSHDTLLSLIHCTDIKSEVSPFCRTR
jgi:hypothetical protein